MFDSRHHPTERMTRTQLASGRVYRLNRAPRRHSIIRQIRLMWRRRQAG